jgi:hypothetical protein
VTLALPRKNSGDNGRQTASRSDGLSDGEKWEELTDGFNLAGGAKRAGFSTYAPDFMGNL